MEWQDPKQIVFIKFKLSQRTYLAFMSPLSDLTWGTWEYRVVYSFPLKVFGEWEEKSNWITL